MFLKVVILMLSVKQVAEELNVCQETIKRKLQKGIYKGIKVGTRWRISEEEIERIKKGE